MTSKKLTCLLCSEKVINKIRAGILDQESGVDVVLLGPFYHLPVKSRLLCLRGGEIEEGAKYQ